MTKDEALRLAFEALKQIDEAMPCPVAKLAQAAIKEALAQPEQEPVAFINVEQRKLEWAKYMSWDTPTVVNLPKIPLYTTPPQRTWVGLTDEEIADCAEKMEASDPTDSFWREFFRGIEAKLKEKNT